MDALRLAVAAGRCDLDEAAGRLQDSLVSGSCIGTRPVSSRTVATQIAFEPDIGGVSAGSMMIQPVAARGSLGGTSRLTCRKTPPRGSLSMKLRRLSSRAMKRDCSQMVAPGGGATPPTMTSPTSPSAWAETTWMTFALRIRSSLRGLNSTRGLFPTGKAAGLLIARPGCEPWKQVIPSRPARQDGDDKGAMKFERLRVAGFKSFCDPTEFKIEPGLTGVVGPNGCGKSNLTEAMRWVMGENSYKNMRASGMEDVIFSGSGRRPSRNIAEVGLVIDNSDRRAPAAFNNSETIEIVRRIERDKGSTYKINGREARARDVQLLFADASTGARSPAMVRQGQIGEIIAAKPAARRLVLEEAAGVAGLHSRRHEAELRLKAAEENLTRLEDVLKQVELAARTRCAGRPVRASAIAASARRSAATRRWPSSSPGGRPRRVSWRPSAPSRV